ncbi:hypothetical protein I0C86_41030 [Plantactinospora sp. S1510]|uniref:Uncharacterized protein n=1 Tax=Plantactinospora alkalitolerans TaxID=2789879 RepID=A0ABS0H9T4_9ACTN|nr:hypothetical protein [Plantactinospora alkalitolerans]MBF9135236.1 hypothetical protein [Plantactinospora alkalitolerans]
MPWTTTTTYGSRFGKDEQSDSIYAYINGADYGSEHAGTVAAALFLELQFEVDDRLPEGVMWQPQTSAFEHPLDVALPDEEEMTELFAEAWRAVEVRYDEIEVLALLVDALNAYRGSNPWQDVVMAPSNPIELDLAGSMEIDMDAARDRFVTTAGIIVRRDPSGTWRVAGKHEPTLSEGQAARG